MNNISVIVPVYKTEPYLNRCIDSVINQTLTDFELILTDDGSPDACGGICDEYAVSDERLVIIHQQNGGLSAARNVGIDWSFACSDSEWISFIYSDDYVDKCYLQFLYDAVQQTYTDISICNIQVDGAGQISARDTEGIANSTPMIISVEDAWLDSGIQTISAWGYLYKKLLFEDIRYPIGKIYEDAFTTYKVVFKCLSIAYVSTKLYLYNYGSPSITRSSWTPKKLDKIEACKQTMRFFEAQGNSKILLHETKWYMYILASFTNETKADTKYKRLHKALKKELRRQIRVYKKTLNLKMGNNKYYLAAYPRITYLYCVMTAGLKKIRRNFSNSRR